MFRNGLLAKNGSAWLTLSMSSLAVARTNVGSTSCSMFLHVMPNSARWKAPCVCSVPKDKMGMSWKWIRQQRYSSKKETTTTTGVGSASSSSSHTTATATGIGRVKELWHKYGIVAIGTYFTTYVVVLSSMYMGIEYGLIDTSPPSKQKPKEGEKEDFNLIKTTNRFVDIAQKFGIADFMELEKVSSKTGTFLLAWIATKFTEPLRLAFTVAVTPRVARILGRSPKL